MKKFSLKKRLIASFLLAGIIPMLVVGFYSTYVSQKALKEDALAKLNAVRDLKADSVKRYFEIKKDQLFTFSHNSTTEGAMISFKEAFNNYSSEQAISKADEIVHESKVSDFYQNQFGAKYSEDVGTKIETTSLYNQLSTNQMALQYAYIANNSNPLGSKSNLDRADDGSTYSKVHAKYHPDMREYLEKFGFYDIFLVDIDSGNIVYSVYKEADFATSLLDGPYRDTNFADAFRKARDLSSKSEFVAVDYKKYTPSYEAPASFIATPIWSGNKKIGVAVFQMPIDRLNAIVSSRSGLGESGESYLFGTDKLMRTDSFLDHDNFSVMAAFNKPEAAKLHSTSIDAALKGETGDKITNNYLNQEVLSAYTPVKVLGLEWGMITEISTSEAFEAIRHQEIVIYTMLCISAFLISLFAYFTSNGLAKRIQSIASRLLENANEVAVSSGDIESTSGQLSEAATQAASSLQETVSSIDEISSMVKRNADAAGNSTHVSNKSNEAAMQGKKTVEVMINSIKEISDSNDEIASEMQRNNADISKIVKVIAEIGEKTKVINDIVFQTKLLSFNASVEAARAGEHGKGFAVVAEEVGNLASMSGKAALEITEMLDSSIKEVTDIVDNTKIKVESLMNSSKSKVEVGTKTAYECGDSLDEILQNVSSVNEMVREIASASSEQSTGVQEVTKAMQQLDETTHKNTSVAQESSSMAKKLRTQADGLERAVSELMGVITGDNQIDSNNHLESENKNVFALPRKKNVKEVESQSEHIASKKVSGLDTSVPAANDPRFEDL